MIILSFSFLNILIFTLFFIFFLLFNFLLKSKLFTSLFISFLLLPNLLWFKTFSKRVIILIKYFLFVVILVDILFLNKFILLSFLFIVVSFENKFKNCLFTIWDLFTKLELLKMCPNILNLSSYGQYEYI